MELGLNIRWTFTEAGHGKSSCDGIGGKTVAVCVFLILYILYYLGVLKTKASALTAFSTGEQQISNAMDLVTALEGETAVRLHLHTAEDIARVKESIPGQLSSLTGALKIHQISISKEGVMSSKLMPGDEASKIFNIVTRVRGGTATVIGHEQ